LDRTLSCPVPQHGGVNLLYLFARIKGEPPTRMYFWKLPNPATLEVDAARQLYLVRNTQHVLATTYAGASPTMKDGYTFDDSACRNTRPIPLARAGLPTFGVFNGKHGAYGLAQDCWLAPVATVRMRVTFGRSGRPVAARLALRSGSRLRPVAYVEWTPTRVRAWISKGSCHPHTGL
jgi:hypothetical protein